MSGNAEVLALHVERARMAGAEVEVLAAAEWLRRLEPLVREVGSRTVALPSRGWPEGLREAVVEALAGLGCRVVSPEPRDGGFAWDRDALAAAELGISWCGAFVADTGSVAFPAGPGLGTAASLLPFVHLAVGKADDLFPDLGTYLRGFGGKLPSRLTLVTGPSRTGDIEGTMNTGVHGPGRVLQWLLTESGAAAGAV